MPDILPLQIGALLLGMASISIADIVYHNASITQRLHSLWVSGSISAMCLPILGWTVTIFFGPGVLARGLVGGLEAALFVSLYRNLRNLPTMRKLGHGLPPPSPPAVRTPPPTDG
jgi:hypothetical protein